MSSTSRITEIVNAVREHEGEAIAVVLGYTDALHALNLSGIEVTAVRGIPIVRRSGTRTLLITVDEAGEPRIIPI